MCRILFRVCLALALVACNGSGIVPVDTDNDSGSSDDSGADDSGETDTDPTPDADGDGVLSPVDCDDTDPTVNPMADEVCDDGIDNDCDLAADLDDADCWRPFSLTAEIWAWVGGIEGWEVCGQDPCLDYVQLAAVGYGEALPVEQLQSWPVYVRWTSDVPVTVPALGRTAAVFEGEAYFNPWQEISVAFCNGLDCRSSFDISVTNLPARSDCAAQTVDGMFENSPDWTASNGEAYGVSNFDGVYCTHYSCTDSAPSQACIANDNPNEDECSAYGCECNLDSWSRACSTRVQYNASVTADSGVRAPWFADRWETGGMHAANDGATVFRMRSEVKIDDPNILFRPVIDMRSDWNGSWSSIPHPDGWEGPPVFRSDVNEFIAPSDGFFPIEWEAAPSASYVDVWMQPVWNFIVRPGGENGTAELQNLAFSACGADVAEISCGSNGCSY